MVGFSPRFHARWERATLEFPLLLLDFSDVSMQTQQFRLILNFTLQIRRTSRENKNVEFGNARGDGRGVRQ